LIKQIESIIPNKLGRWDIEWINVILILIMSLTN
jgi:hypothetical protein